MGKFGNICKVIDAEKEQRINYLENELAHIRRELQDLLNKRDKVSTELYSLKVKNLKEEEFKNVQSKTF
jgi:hypothetical protein